MDKEEFDRKYTGRLNRQQSEAVHAVEGAVLLLAVPGSGKTTVLVTRLGYMLCCCGIPADKILTMTYTKAATREMEQRFVRLFGEDCPKIPEFRTINGVSSKIINSYSKTHGRRKVPQLIEDESLSKLVSNLYHELSGEFATQGSIKELRKYITYVKNSMLDKEEIDELDTGFEKFPELYKKYNAKLRKQSWMDYDDQMVYAKRILEHYPDILAHFQNMFPYICVDESQDTSKIQHAIIQLLAQKSGNIFMVGDEDQSIYGFRSAYPEALVQFEQTYPDSQVLLMEENYRSTPEILRLADDFIRQNRGRHPKTIHPTRASGADVQLITVSSRADQYTWLTHIASQHDGEMAILYRNNDSALPLIDWLDRQGIPYYCKQMDDTYFTHRIVTDIKDIIAFAHNGQNAETFLRIYYKCGGGISRKAAEDACERSRGSGKTILEELLSSPQLSPYARGRIADLIDLLPQILRENSRQGLKLIWHEMHYKDYVEQQKLDTNKFEILCLLAEQEPSLDALLDRLDKLRSLVITPSEPSENAVLLSTIHSSKGLEYDTVYLLDVLDGILPVVSAPKDESEQGQYQEERRLFYVAVTRAKNHLYLFFCANQSSAFIEEVQQNIPTEVPEEDDVFGIFLTDLCGKRYYHVQNGLGNILATCNGQCLIEYGSGETQFLTVGQMCEQRRIVRKLQRL